MDSITSFPNMDLFAAGINALNGTLVARNPQHNRGYTMAGLIIMAFFGGIGGGVTRDLLLNQIPGPLKSPEFLVVCVLMALLGFAIYGFAHARGELFRTRTLAIFKSFTLPWFAILGAHRALEQDLGIFAAVVVGLIATTAGGVFIDLFSGVTPEVVEPSEHVVTTAVIAAAVYAVLAQSGMSLFQGTLIAVVIGFGFRLLATHRHLRQVVIEPDSQTPGSAPPAPAT